MNIRRNLYAAAAVACTALFSWLALRNVQFAQLWQILSAVNWRWLAGIAFLTLVADLGLRALRWRILLSQAVRAPVGALYRFSAIGLAVNSVVFARVGELVRAVLAARKLRVPVATVLASVVVERLLDVAALLALFVAAASYLPSLVAAPVRNSCAVFLAAVLGGLGFLIWTHGTLRSGGWLECRLRRWPTAHGLAEQLAVGAAVLRRPKALVPTVLLSLALWTVDAVNFWMGACALGLQRFVDFPRSVLMLSWGGVGAVIPAAPGGIGTFEQMVKSLMVRLGASPPEAFACALFIHMTGYIMVTALGLALLYREGLSLAEVKESLELKPL